MAPSGSHYPLKVPNLQKAQIQRQYYSLKIQVYFELLRNQIIWIALWRIEGRTYIMPHDWLPQHIKLNLKCKRARISIIHIIKQNLEKGFEWFPRLAISSAEKNFKLKTLTTSNSYLPYAMSCLCAGSIINPIVLIVLISTFIIGKGFEFFH